MQQSLSKESDTGSVKYKKATNGYILSDMEFERFHTMIHTKMFDEIGNRE